MTNRKKLTMKEVTKRLDFWLQQIIQTQKATEYIHKVLSFYIDYKGDKDEFAEHSTKKEKARQKQQQSEET